jgi:hypothetical protein
MTCVSRRVFDRRPQAPLLSLVRSRFMSSAALLRPIPIQVHLPQPFTLLSTESKANTAIASILHTCLVIIPCGAARPVSCLKISIMELITACGDRRRRISACCMTSTDHEDCEDHARTPRLQLVPTCRLLFYPAEAQTLCRLLHSSWPTIDGTHMASCELAGKSVRGR